MNNNIRSETIEDMLDLKDLLNKNNKNELCAIRSKINWKRHESDDYNYFFSILEEDDLEICKTCKNYYCNSLSCYSYQEDDHNYEQDYSYSSDQEREHDYNHDHDQDYYIEDIYLYDDVDY